MAKIAIKETEKEAKSNESTKIVENVENAGVSKADAIPDFDPATIDKQEADNNTPEAGELSVVQVAASAMVVKAAIIALGQILFAITKVEEAKCDDIADQLAEIWAPFMPETSPMTAAILTTMAIVAPKVGIVAKEYRTNKNGAKIAVEAATKDNAEAGKVKDDV